MPIVIKEIHVNTVVEKKVLLPDEVSEQIYIRLKERIVEGKKFHKQSPDMSRLITVKEGETLPYLCHKIYGDSRLVLQVARFNNLGGFRNIPAGTEAVFPPLKKD